MKIKTISATLKIIKAKISSMDIKSPEFWFYVVGGISAVALGVGFVTALVGLTLSWKMNRQLERDLKDKEAQIVAVKRDATRIETESNEKIEAANREAQEREAKIKADAEIKIAEAHAIGQQANEKAGEANERAAGIEKQNLELRVGVANLEKEAADAKRAYFELQERVKPRSLTAEESARLKEMLEKGLKGYVVINCILGDSESTAFANELNEVLKAAGWQTSDVRPSVYGPTLPNAVQVRVHAGSPIPVHALSLLKAMQAVSILSAGVPKEEIQKGVVELVVGTKY